MWIIIAAILLCLVIAVFIILPPSSGKAKPFLDENGDILSGSISEKIFVDVYGASLGMFIMALDSNNPVLLFLDGW